MNHRRFIMRAIVLLFSLATSTFAGQIVYTIDILTETPINPIHFSFTTNGFLTANGSLPLTPFDVTDTPGNTWTFTTGTVGVSSVTGADVYGCLAFVAPPATGAAPPICGAQDLPPGGGFFFIFSPSGDPLKLPQADGSFAVGASFGLRHLDGSFDSLSPIQNGVLTVSSVPEPSSILLGGAGLIAIFAIRRRGKQNVVSGTVSV